MVVGDGKDTPNTHFTLVEITTSEHNHGLGPYTASTYNVWLDNLTPSLSNHRLSKFTASEHDHTLVKKILRVILS